MGEKKRKYEMEECKECEVEGKNAKNGYSLGGLCIFWLDMNIDRTCTQSTVNTFKYTFNRRITCPGKFYYN